VVTTKKLFIKRSYHMKHTYALLVSALLFFAPIFADTEALSYIDDIQQNLHEAQEDINNAHESGQTASEHALDTVDHTHSALQNMREAIQSAIALLMHYFYSYIGSDTTEATPSEKEIRAQLMHRNGEQQLDSRKEKILAQVAKIISGVFNIARDPHNAHNVGDSVGNMVHGIINITVDAIKNRENKKMTRAQLDQLCKEITEEVTLILENKNAA
jgi:hypothetical protein